MTGCKERKVDKENDRCKERKVDKENDRCKERKRLEDIRTVGAKYCMIDKIVTRLMKWAGHMVTIVTRLMEWAGHMVTMRDKRLPNEMGWTHGHNERQEITE